MDTDYPAKIERQFRVAAIPGHDKFVMRIVIEPGRVVLLDGAHGGLTWHQAEHYAAELLEASRAARILSELKEEARFHHSDELDLFGACVKCGQAIREGVVTTTEGGGRRHVTGSPECGR